MSKKRKSNFKDKVKRDAERQKKAAFSYGYMNLPKDINSFSPEPGSRVTLDILPYIVTDERHPDKDVDSDVAVVDSLWYKRPFKVHRNIGNDNESYVCLGSIGKKCPVCEYKNKLTKEGADKDDIAALRPSLRNLYVVIPLGNKKYEEEIHIWDMSQWLFQNLLNEELEEDPDNAAFPELEDGFSLKIRFDSKTIGKSNPFAEASRIDFLERDEQYSEETLDDVPNLDDVLTILSYSELQSKFFELDEEDEPEDSPERETEDDEPSPKKRTPQRKRKIRTEEEESKEEESKQEEEDEEPEKSSRKPIRKKTREGKQESSSKNKCPHGYTFGKDCEKFDECDDCTSWEDCYDEKENLE